MPGITITIGGLESLRRVWNRYAYPRGEAFFSGFRFGPVHPSASREEDNDMEPWILFVWSRATNAVMRLDYGMLSSACCKTPCQWPMAALEFPSERHSLGFVARNRIKLSIMIGKPSEADFLPLFNVRGRRFHSLRYRSHMLSTSTFRR